MKVCWAFCVRNSFLATAEARQFLNRRVKTPLAHEAKTHNLTLTIFHVLRIKKLVASSRKHPLICLSPFSYWPRSRWFCFNFARAFSSCCIRLMRSSSGRFVFDAENDSLMPGNSRWNRNCARGTWKSEVTTIKSVIHWRSTIGLESMASWIVFALSAHSRICPSGTPCAVRYCRR